MSTPSIHVLRRRNWRFAGDYLVLLPGHVRLQSFTDADEAASMCHRHNQKVRSRINPFRCGGPALRNHTSLDSGRLHDWALDQGLTPPESDWVAWWDENFPRMDALQRDEMWKAFDRLRFYEVVEQPQRPVVYIAVAVNWQYNDQWFVADSEGGETHFAFRTREEAEDYAEEANKLQRENWEDPALGEDPEEGRMIVLPTFRGKQGNPMIWDRRFFAEILAIAGDSGARFLVGKHAEAVCEVEMADDAVLRDFDTTESLATLPPKLRPEGMA